MIHEFIDADGVTIGCGTAAELAEYIANGWVPEGATLGEAL
jgi:hypothetical protein